MKTLSIIVISFNTKELLRNCLNSIRKYTPSEKIETIVVDNGSKDGSQQMIETEFPEVHLIQTGSNLGFAKAANIGIQNSSGEFLYFLNSDTELLENSVEVMISHLRDHPGTGIAGAREQFANGRSYPTICPFPDLRFLFLTHTGFRHRFYRNRYINPYRAKWEEATASGRFISTDWISGANLMVRRKLFDDIGLFDENYFFYMEETDLCKRAWAKGLVVTYVPDAVVIHHGGGSAATIPSGLLTLSGALSDLYYIKKYRPLSEFFFLRIMFVFEFLIKLVFFGSGHSRRRAYKEILMIATGLTTFKNPSENINAFMSKNDHA